MNMEGYGPVSAGMGGASQAMDHGSAAMAQNPATLGLMGQGARFDAALGVLGPKVASSMAAGAGSLAAFARDAGLRLYAPQQLLVYICPGGMGTE
jgi:long-chain fatty acid transport protein